MPVTTNPPVASIVYGDIGFQSVTQPAQVLAMGATVPAQSPNSVASSTVAVSADGSFFITDLPSGDYSVTATADGFISFAVDSVSVSSTGTASDLNPPSGMSAPPGSSTGPTIVQDQWTLMVQ